MVQTIYIFSEKETEINVKCLSHVHESSLNMGLSR
jgi:hypothetical protein